MKKVLENKSGFTLVETLVYLLIMATLIGLIGSIVLNVFNSRKHIKALTLMQNDVAVLTNFVGNKIHNVEVIETTTSTEGFYFYSTSTERFAFAEENGNVVFKESESLTGEFPPFASSTPLILSNDRVKVSNFDIYISEDAEGNSDRGVGFTFTLTVGTSTQHFGHVQRDYNLFFSLR